MRTKELAKKMAAFCMVLVMALSVTAFCGREETAVTGYAAEYLYEGTLDIASKGWSTYYTGLNYNMTGGTAGAIYQGAKLSVIAEKTNSKGNKICYCYSEDLGKNCYVSSRYIKKTEPAVTTERKGTLDIASKGWSTYYTGLNYNMTGGTAGAIYQGAELTILAEQKNKNNNLIYYCYSKDLGKNCYVSSKYVVISEVVEEQETTTETTTNYREAIVKVALEEFGANGNKKLAEPVKYNYAYSTKVGGGRTKWCCDFITWCSAQAGVPMSVVPHEKDSSSWAQTEDGYSNYGRYYKGYSLAYVPDLVKYLTKYCDAEYYKFGSAELKNGQYVPQSGDIIVYRTAENTYMHVGLVVEVNTATGDIVTVEGNTSYGNYEYGCLAKKYRNYTKEKITSDWYIQGFVSPKYE